MAGLLYDVGKVKILLDILNKPGALDPQEWTTMSLPSERGDEVLKRTGGICVTTFDAVLHHHEKMDGSGYPDRLKTDQITQLAKMTAVGDGYDAFTSTRPRKNAWQPTEAVCKMKDRAGGNFDEAIFKPFVKTVGICPVGSLVRVHSQRLAVVIDNDPQPLLEPTVTVCISLRSNSFVSPIGMKLGKGGSGARIAGCEHPQTHGLSRVDEIWSALNRDASSGSCAFSARTGTWPIRHCSTWGANFNRRFSDHRFHSWHLSLSGSA
jgi:hypothetical protein